MRFPSTRGLRAPLRPFLRSTTLQRLSLLLLVPLLAACVASAPLLPVPLPGEERAPASSPPPPRVGSLSAEELEPPTPDPKGVESRLGVQLAEAGAEAFQAALDRARDAHGVSGAQFAAVRLGGAGWFGSSGRDRKAGTSMGPSTPLVIGSITKTFVAALALQLAEEGRMRLADRLVDHLPEAAWLAPDITIRHLLSHTSGIDDLYNSGSRAMLDRLGSQGLVPQDAMRLVKPRGTAGSYSYSNTNYLLLAMAIERVVGRSLEEELSARFLDPLELHDTSVLSSAAPGSRLTAAWAGAFFGSGSMTSSARDVARWGEAIYSGEVLRQRTIRQMSASVTRSYGLGAQIFTVRGNRAVGHTGLLGGQTSILIWLPTQRVSLALIADKPRANMMRMLNHRENGNPSLMDLAWALGS